MRAGLWPSITPHFVPSITVRHISGGPARVAICLVGVGSVDFHYSDTGRRKGTPASSGATAPSASAGSTGALRTEGPSGAPTGADTAVNTGELAETFRQAYALYQTGRQIYDWVNTVSGAAVAATERAFPGSTAKTHEVWGQVHEPQNRWPQRQGQSPAKSYRTSTVGTSSRRSAGGAGRHLYFRAYRAARWRLRGRRGRRRRRY